ncbi:MAG: MFS transporter [Pseudomonadota bacterium]
MKETKTFSSWKSALSIYKERAVLAMLFFGFSAGLPFLIVFATTSAWLRTEGVTRTAIGFFSWAALTYGFKFVWAPLVDHLRLPILHNIFGRRRSWIFLAQIFVAIGIFLMAIMGPNFDLKLFALFVLIVSFASATQDIGIDAWRIESAPIELQGGMSAAYQFGYRIALIVSGAGALYMADYSSWNTSYLIMASLMSVGLVTTFIVAEPDTSSIKPLGKHWLKNAVISPFIDFYQRHRSYAFLLLLLIGVFRLSDISMGVMAYPLYIDLGFTLTEIANVSKVFGVAVTMVGVAAAGVFIARFGVFAPLLYCAIATSLTTLLFALLAIFGNNLELFILAIVGDNLTAGVTGTVLIAFLSSLTNKEFTATQYALFTSLLVLPGKLLAGFSGAIVDNLNYPIFFAYAAALGLPAILLTFYLKQRKYDPN